MGEERKRWEERRREEGRGDGAMGKGVIGPLRGDERREDEEEHKRVR